MFIKMEKYEDKQTRDFKFIPKGVLLRGYVNMLHTDIDILGQPFTVTEVQIVDGWIGLHVKNKEEK